MNENDKGCAGLAIKDSVLPVRDAHAELRRLAEAATPGPWHIVYGDDDRHMCMTAISAKPQRSHNVGQFGSDEELVAVTFHQCYPVVDQEGDDCGDSNSAYIAAANPARILALLDELEQHKRMFMAACEDLGAINECLGLDPDDGGAEPILEAIEDLRAALTQAAPASPDLTESGTITLSGNQLRAALEFVNPDGPSDEAQCEEELTFGVRQHRDDDGAVSTGICCWNDDTDGVLPLDGEYAAPASPALPDNLALSDNPLPANLAPASPASAPVDERVSTVDEEVCHSPVCGDNCSFPRCMGPEPEDQPIVCDSISDDVGFVGVLGQYSMDVKHGKGISCTLPLTQYIDRWHAINGPAATEHLAAPVEQAGVPDGWKLVPVEPTDAMREACPCHEYYADIDADWAAMLAAAPLPPVVARKVLDAATIHETCREVLTKHAQVDGFPFVTFAREIERKVLARLPGTNGSGVGE